MRGQQKRCSEGGFTLIELLVVIAIIGLLASIVIASVGTANQKGRDGRRISDVKQIQLALELYFDACSTYPTDIYAASSGCTGGIAPDYISVVPTDPLSQLKYAYVALVGNGTSGSCGSYHLGTKLETSQSSSATDAAGCPGGTYNTSCAATNGTYDGSVCSGSTWAGNADVPATSGDFTGSRTSPGIFDVKP